ncbi:MAG: peroxiredoxin family protein [Candidatus Limnocylindrales bacterium]
MSRERPTFEHRPPRHGLIGPFGARQLAAGLVVVVVAIILLLGVTAPLGTTGAIGARDPRATPYLIGSPPAVGLRPGDRAPDFTVTRTDGSTFTLSDLAGRPLSLAALRGRGVWIDFWATWCPPCQAETPVLRDTYAAYRDRGLSLVAISVQETSVADVAAYAARYGLQYTIAADVSADIFHRYGVFALPTQFFVDPNGIIRDVVQGPMTMASAAAEVEAILPATPPSAPPAAPPSALLGVPAASAVP